MWENTFIIYNRLISMYIWLKEKKADMFKKMTSELRGCSADGDCEGAEKCKELPKVGIDMCMSGTES